MKRSNLTSISISAVFIAALTTVGAPAAHASIITVGTADTALTAYIGANALVTNTLKYNSGTGNFDPFLSIDSNNRDDEWGYNTATGHDLDAVNGGTRTHLEMLDSIPTVLISGVKYREFILDINQSGQNPISLNQIQIFAGAAATDSPYPNGAAVTNYDVSSGLGFTPLFQLNNFPSGPPSITEIQVPSFGYGSGHADMALYVPDSIFAGKAATDYVTVFTQMGSPPGHDAQTDGYEEWGVQKNSGGFGPGTPTPEPSTLALLGGAAVFGIFVARRKLRV
jgi:hypothetical protein